MPVLPWGNVIQVVHTGEGNEPAARDLVAEIRQKMAGAPEGRVALYHDATRLDTAGQDYAMVFAALMRELPKARVLHVSVVPKAWMRVLSKTAAVLGGVEMHTFKTSEEAVAFLAAQGFVVPDLNQL